MNIEEEIFKRKEKAKNLGLPDLIRNVYNEVQYYPSWFNNEENKSAVCGLITMATGKDSDFTIEFNNRQFRFKVVDSHSYFDSSLYKDIELYINNEIVFGANYSVHVGQHATILSFIDITAFKEDSWIDDMKLLNKTIEIKNENCKKV